MIEKQPFIIFLPKNQRIYEPLYAFASDALHIVIFENFVKTMKSCLSKSKVTPSFCFAFKIPDDPTATIIQFPFTTMCFFLFSAWKVCRGCKTSKTSPSTAQVGAKGCHYLKAEGGPLLKHVNTY